MRLTTPRYWLVLLAAMATMVLLAPLAAQAADPPAAPPAAQAADSSVFKGLQATVGYQIDLSGKGDNPLYYRLSWRDHLLKEQGTAPTDSNLATSAAGLSAAADNLLALTIERGQGDFTGGLFDALGVESLKPLNVGFLRDVRGAVRFAGNVDGGTSLSIGVESPPWHFLGSGGSTPNWLIVGASHASGQDQAYEATYRAFVGHSFGNVRRAGDPTLAEIRKLAPTYLDGAYLYAAYTFGDDKRKDVVVFAVRELCPGINDVKQTWKDRVHDDALFKQFGTLAAALSDYKTNGEGSKMASVLRASGVVRDVPDDTWNEKLQQVMGGARGQFASPNQPTAAVWLEGAGWYSMTGDTVDEERFHNMFAATGTLWFNPRQGGSTWLRARYEVGRTRAAPDDERNRLLLSLGASF